MGCGNPKEKIEDEMMKLKISRIELQMERYNQLQLLKGMNGGKFKTSKIPDYIDQKFLNNYFIKKNHLSSITINKDPIVRRRQSRSKSCKNVVIKRKSKIFNFNESENEIRKSKKRTTAKRRTFKF